MSARGDTGVYTIYDAAYMMSMMNATAELQNFLKIVFNVLKFSEFTTLYIIKNTHIINYYCLYRCISVIKKKKKNIQIKNLT